MLTYDQAMGYIERRRRRTIADRGAGPAPLPAAAQLPARAIEKRPFIEMPAGGNPFDRLNNAAVTLPAIGTEVVVVQFTVPRGKNGVIVRISNQFVGGGWVEGTGDLVWRIEADGVPVRDYESIIASLGTTSNPGDRRGNPIRIFENQRIQLICLNVAVGVAGQPLLGLLGGWFYPIEQEGESYFL